MRLSEPPALTPPEPPPSQRRIVTQVVRDRVERKDGPTPELRPADAPALHSPEPPSLGSQDLGQDSLTPLGTPVMVSEAMGSMEDTPGADLVIPIADEELERKRPSRSLLLAAAIGLLLVLRLGAVGLYALGDGLHLGGVLAG